MILFIRTFANSPRLTLISYEPHILWLEFDVNIYIELEDIFAID